MCVCNYAYLFYRAAAVAISGSGEDGSVGMHGPNFPVRKLIGASEQGLQQNLASLLPKG